MALDYELLNRAIARQGGQPLEPPPEPELPHAVALDVPALQAPVVEPLAQPAPPPEVPPPAPAQALVRTLEPGAAPSVAATPPPAPATPSLGTAAGYGVEDTMRSLDELTTGQAEAAMRAAEAEGAAGKRKAEAGDTYAREVDEISKRHETREAAAEEMFQRTMGEFRALNDAANALPPARDRRDRGQRAWGVLAVALGGTDAANIINAGVNRDIALQQAAIDNKRKGAESKLTELGLARQFIGDQREATRFASALRKERFAGEVEAAAGELSSQTARDKGLQVAAQYKVEARKEQLDVLKKIMGGKMNALEAAMMIKLGVMSPAEARARMVAGEEPVGEAPAARVAGGLTKTQQGQVNLTTHQNEIPGVEWLVDPSQVTPEDRENVQKIKSGMDGVTRTVARAKAAYLIAADPKRPDKERLTALGRYRNLMTSQMPGYLSQATGSGTPQEAEVQRLLQSLPPVPVVNDVAGLRGALQSLENWRDDRSTDPAGFDYFVEDFADIAAGRMANYKGRPAPVQAGESQANGGRSGRGAGGRGGGGGATQSAKPPAALPDLSDRFRRPKKK